jgi:hypothetical protein
MVLPQRLDKRQNFRLDQQSCRNLCSEVFTDDVTIVPPTSVTITQPAQVLAATYTTVNACNVPTASVTVTATGGTSTLQIFIYFSTTQERMEQVMLLI